jgi:hypothetical protein
MMQPVNALFTGTDDEVAGAVVGKGDGIALPKAFASVTAEGSPETAESFDGIETSSAPEGVKETDLDCD